MVGGKTVYEIEMVYYTQKRQVQDLQSTRGPPTSRFQVKSPLEDLHNLNTMDRNCLVHHQVDRHKHSPSMVHTRHFIRGKLFHQFRSE